MSRIREEPYQGNHAGHDFLADVQLVAFPQPTKERERSAAVDRLARQIRWFWSPSAGGRPSQPFRQALAERAYQSDQPATEVLVQLLRAAVPMAISEGTRPEPVKLSGASLRDQDGRTLEVQPLAIAWCYRDPGAAFLRSHLKGLRRDNDVGLAWVMYWLVRRVRKLADHELVPQRARRSEDATPSDADVLPLDELLIPGDADTAHQLEGELLLAQQMELYRAAMAAASPQQRRILEVCLELGERDDSAIATELRTTRGNIRGQLLKWRRKIEAAGFPLPEDVEGQPSIWFERLIDSHHLANLPVEVLQDVW